MGIRTSGGEELLTQNPARNLPELFQSKLTGSVGGWQQKERYRTQMLGEYHESMRIRRQRIGVENGKTGAGGVFNNGTEYGTKSLFNKEKWLPACQELPFLISHYCCNQMKKKPMKKYAHDTGRKSMMATMAVESRIRKQGWIRNGCNAFDSKDAKSTPMAFWTENDVLEYIVKYGVEICEVYGEVVGEDGMQPLAGFGCKLHCTGCSRTGCVWCLMAAHAKDDTRFIELARLSPAQYEYSMRGGQWADNPYYDATAPEYDGDWKNWNPKKIWVPSKEGLGLRFVINEFNQLYPKNQIKLPE